MTFNLGKYSCIIWIGYYDGWPIYKHGTNFWCLEIGIANKWHKNWKLDFWKPKDNAGWIVIKTLEGIICVHSKHYKQILN